MLSELDFTVLLKKKVPEILLKTHYYIFSCFLLPNYDCSPQGYDASVRTRHYVLPRLFFNPNTLKAIRDGLRDFCDSGVWKSHNSHLWPWCLLKFSKCTLLKIYPVIASPSLNPNTSSGRTDFLLSQARGPSITLAWACRGAGKSHPGQARAGTQGLKSQQGAWRTVSQWASDSDTWAAQIPICLAHNFLFKHAYGLSYRPPLRESPSNT